MKLKIIGCCERKESESPKRKRVKCDECPKMHRTLHTELARSRWCVWFVWAFAARRRSRQNTMQPIASGYFLLNEISTIENDSRSSRSLHLDIHSYEDVDLAFVTTITSSTYARLHHFGICKRTNASVASTKNIANRNVFIAIARSPMLPGGCAE